VFRVLQVVLSLHPGGTERLVLELVKRLHAEIPMGVCCLDERGAWASELQDRGIPVVELRRRPGFHPALAQAVAGVIHEHGATLVHAHHYSPFVYAALARIWQPRTRIVFTEHGRVSDAPPSRKRRAANLFLARLSSATFAVSGDLGAHLVGEGFSPRAVEVIYNGIDVGPRPDVRERLSARHALGIPAETIVVGTIARLDKVKSLDTLIRAAALAAHDRPLSLVIIGDGPERRALETAAARTGSAAAIRFLGHRDDARRLLPACDVFANSSISEGVSLTILEAMAAGLPVVATRVGGTPEVIDETCGRLVPARNEVALARAIEDLAAAPALRATLGRAARQRVEDRFTLDRMVRAYRAVYDRFA
jgi:glycosyltransferase involved in cell wall biosynthesis